MDRRAFLASSVSLLAGCPGQGNSEQEPTLTPAPVRTASTTESTAPVDHDRFERFGCPSFLDRSLQQICSHELPPDPGIVFQPRPVVMPVSPDGRLAEPVMITLYSRLAQPLSVFERSWELYRYEAGDWRQFTSGTGSATSLSIDPGDRHYWLLHSGERDRTGAGVTASQVTLDPGVYAFATVVITAESMITIECIGLFEVVPEAQD